MKKYLFLFAIVITALSGEVFAEVYKTVHSDGQITYSNIKTKGSTHLEFDPDANMVSQASAICIGEQGCKKAFALTQVYISENSDMKLETVTDNIIETYNASEVGRLGMKAIRTPNKANQETIKLIVFCSEESKLYLNCIERRSVILQNFPAFISLK
jgi:hypothetical protein